MTSSKNIARVLVPLLITCACSAAHARAQVKHDTAFHNLQMRGRVVMGVDQYTSTHKFEDLADGGRIELQRDSADPTGVAAIREHLQAIAKAFAAGDFSAPAIVHMKEVPGVAVMAARRKLIRYTFRGLDRGGAVRIESRDPAAIRAIHDFLSFQRSEHRVH
jgi:hypothetical protein